MYSLLACRRGTRPARQLAARLLALLAAVVLCISGSMYTSVDASASNSIATSIGANASSMAACNSALGMLPSWMVSRFQEAGYSVAVTTQDINTVYLDGKYAGQNITGAFSSGKKIIVVANQAKAYSYLVKYATIHEMGHWVDYTTSGSGYTYASDRGDFLKIYNSEYAAYKAAFGMDDVNMAQTKEFFACAFRRYYTDGALLKSRCPGLYAYIEGRIDTLYYMPVFDADYYLARYPDLKIAFGSDMTAAIRHFTRYGMDEGRQAKAAFSVSSYRYKYQDLRLVYGTSLKKYYIHYIEYGRLEGRKATGTSSLQDPVTCLGGVDYSAVYDYAYNLNKYPDLRKAYGDDDVALLRHFIQYGMREGWQAKNTFNVASYRYAYPDLRIAFGDDLPSYYMHYIRFGKKEGRAATGVTSLQSPVTSLDGIDYAAVYDYAYYLNKYADLRKAYGADDVALLRHFIQYGMREGRQAKSTFNVSVYKSRYADLRKAFGNDLEQYYLHYIRYGWGEGRTAA